MGNLIYLTYLNINPRLKEYIKLAIIYKNVRFKIFGIEVNQCPQALNIFNNTDQGIEYRFRSTVTKQVFDTWADFLRIPAIVTGIGMSTRRSFSNISNTLNSVDSGWRSSLQQSRQRWPNQALSSSKVFHVSFWAASQMRLRLSCTFFSTTPFSHPEATLQKSASNR